MNFQAITATGGSGGAAISDSIEAIGGSPKTIYLKMSGSGGGTHYTVPAGKRFTGYVHCGSGGPVFNGVTFDQNDATWNQNYVSGAVVRRFCAGDTIGSTSGYLSIMGTEST